jgi:CubicO group peptidase (beta-lactamase class C family)
MSHICRMRSLLFALVLLVILGFGTRSQAQSIDRAAIEPWADRVLGGPIAAGSASAATISVVQAGNVVLEKSYGVANAAGRAVDPARDRFLIASVTKTFTATLIAAYVDEGRIHSLDDPANRYLKRTHLPRAFGREITIRQLLTHSAGFEEREFGYESLAGVRIPASPEYIESKLPAVVRAPGTHIVYANIDPPLLGVLLEDLSGLTLRELMHRRLLEPLGMNDTELVYDPSGGPRMIEALKVGRGGERHPMARDINAPFFAPTGSVQTTAADMAKFANAQLGHRPDVVSRAMLSLLQTPGARNAPELMAIGSAFFVGQRNAHTFVDHLGAFSGFEALLVLIPDADTGAFIAWAGAPAPGNAAPPIDFQIEDDFLSLVVGKFVAPAALPLQPDTTALVGTYWNERRGHRSPEVLLSLDDVTIVTRNAHRQLMINGDGPYYSFAAGAFTRAARDGRPGPVYAFADNEIRMNSNYGVKVSGLHNPVTVRTLLVAALVVLWTGALGVFWSSGRTRLLGIAATLIGIAFPIAVFAHGGIEGFVSDILQGVSWRFTLLKVAAVSDLLLAGSLLWALWDSTRSGRPNTVREFMVKAHLAILAAAAVTVVPISWFLNLL